MWNRKNRYKNERNYISLNEFDNPYWINVYYLWVNLRRRYYIREKHEKSMVMIDYTYIYVYVPRPNILATCNKNTSADLKRK